MTTLQFDGKQYDAANLEQVLKEAAHGMPDTSDREHMYDGKEWAGRLIEAAAASSFASAAGQVLGRLLQSDDAAVRELAVSLQYSHKIVSGADTLAAMRKLRAAGEKDAVETLAASVAKMIDKGTFKYTPELREYSDLPDARDSLMRVYLRFDRPWVLSNLTKLFPADPGAALTVMASGLSGMDKSEVQGIAKELAPALSALPDAVAQTVRDYLQKRTA